MMKISAYYPNYFTDFGITHVCYHLMKGMQSEDCIVKLMGISSDSAFSNDKFYSDAIPQWSKSLVYKTFSDKVILNMAESIFSRSLKNTDFAYLWPGISLDTYKNVKSRGYKIIFEAVNTHEVNSKAILDAEYTNLKLPITHGVSAEKVINESAKLELSDYIYSCSPLVTASMLANGVPKSKILQTSYGLSPSAIFDEKKVTISSQPTFIFVGSIGVRKGVHLLLDYWVKAKLNAKLKLVGAIDEALKPLVNQYLAHESIEHIPFTNDLSSIYKNADVFILPSLEEGSPLVMYMALGAGLPVIVSPMGGGGVIVDNEDGFVVDPHDADKWIERMRHLAESAECREQLSRQSKVKVTQYTWNAVAKDRLQSLVKAESGSM
jgi:glycosyltransferase involved in cell wall biosynthesis